MAADERGRVRWEIGLALVGSLVSSLLGILIYQGANAQKESQITREALVETRTLVQTQADALRELRGLPGVIQLHTDKLETLDRRVTAVERRFEK